MCGRLRVLWEALFLLRRMFFGWSFSDFVCAIVWKLSGTIFGHSRPDKPVDVVNAEETIKTIIPFMQLSSVSYLGKAAVKKWFKKRGIQTLVCGYSDKDEQPDFCAALDTRESPAKVLVVIRGTLSIADAVTDMSWEAEGFSKGYAHKGFLASAKDIHTRVASVLKRCGLDWREREWVITGHSLGAGVAAVLSMFLKHKCPSLKVNSYCFATPGCCVSKSLVEESKKVATTVVLDTDLVPQISPQGIDSLHVAVHKFSPVAWFMWTAFHFLTLVGAVLDFPLWLLGGWVCDVYSASLPYTFTKRGLSWCHQQLRGRAETVLPLYIAGSILHLTKLEGEWMCARSSYQTFATLHSDFSVLEHLFWSYEWALGKVLSATEE